MMEPPTCVPIAAGIMLAPTAAAEPEDEPPGVRRGSKGLVVGPGCAMPNSAVTVLPIITAPASRKARTMMLSRFGKLPVNAPQPICVGISAVSIKSLMPIGMPSMAETARPAL